MLNLVKPELKALERQQIELVHKTVLAVLEQTGIKVEDEKARRVFREAGCKELEKGRIALGPGLVEWAIKAAPSKVEVYDRHAAPAFSLEPGQDGGTVFGVGVTNLYYQEIPNDNVVPFGRRHMAASTRLGHALDEFGVISTPGVIQDEPGRPAEVIGALEMLCNTTKPLVLLVSKPDAFAASLDMYAELAGLGPEKPFVLPYLNPITPLILNSETSMKMDLAIERGLPLIFSNYGMSGATCPITPGGTLTLLTAELLAGLVYGQLKKEGAPMILGSLPAVFDMKSMHSYYSAGSMLVNMCCAEMMAHYELPHCGASGGSMGWGPDLNAASLLWLNHLTSRLGRAGLAPFVGSNFDSLVFSPSTVVYAAEVIRFARGFAGGFSLDESDVGLDEIIKLGPGGNYLTSQLTMLNFRSQPPLSGIWPTLGLEKWQEQNQPKAGSVLREYTRELLNNAKPPEDHDHLMSAGEEFISKMPS